MEKEQWYENKAIYTGKLPKPAFVLKAEERKRKETR